jgi:predicted Rossmann fold nucleotide-binding protein DprA/Smf involved in DNA uptake
MTESQQMICRVLKGTDLSADEIMQQTGLEASVVLRELTLLGIRAAVKRTENQRYTLRRSQGS